MAIRNSGIAASATVVPRRMPSRFHAQRGADHRGDTDRGEYEAERPRQATHDQRAHGCGACNRLAKVAAREIAEVRAQLTGERFIEMVIPPQLFLRGPG